MTFTEIIPGLLEGNSYTYTDKDSEVHFFIAISSPINSDGECLCIGYFEDIDEDGEVDPEPLELSPEDLKHNLWREVTREDYYTEEEKS